MGFKHLALSAALAFAVSGTAHADAITGLYNTGAGTIGEADANYSLVDGTAYVSGVVNGAWIQNDSTSRWITPFQDPGTSTDPSTDRFYNYTLSFDLTGFNTSTASFSGRVLADNAVTIFLNGNQITADNIGTFNQWSSFSSASFFNTGANTLTFTVKNFAQNGGNPTGLRVEFLQSAVSAVPEPETYGMMLAGLGLMGFVVSRRKQST